MNGRIVSDIAPHNWPQIIALFQADPSVPAADKKKLAEATEFFMASPPMALKAMYDEMAGMVHLTMGRSSFKVSQALRYMGFNLVPDTDYMKYEFEMDAERCIAYVRGNLKQLATVHKWELELI